METKLIPKGIERLYDSVNTDNLSHDEIVNVRYRDGQWELIHGKDELWDVSTCLSSGVEIIYHVPNKSSNEYIVFTNNTLMFVNAQTKVCTTIKYISNVLTITSYQDVLVAVTDDNVYYFRWDDFHSNYLELPKLINGIFTFCSSGVKDIISGSGVMSPVEAMTTIRLKIKDKNNLGLFTGHTLFRVAFRTVSGDFMFYSSPFYYHVGQPDIDTDTPNQLVYTKATTTTAWHVGRFDKVKFEVHNMSDIYDVISKYKGYITSMCVFASKPITDYDYSWDGETMSTNVDNTTVIPYNPLPESIVKDVDTFKLIHETPLDDLLGLSTYSETIKLNPEEYETLESLGVNNNTNSLIFSSITYDFNSRLHIASVNEKFPIGDNIPLPDYFVIAYEKAQMLPNTATPGNKTDLSFLASSGATEGVMEYNMIESEGDNYNSYIERFDVPVFKNASSKKYIIVKGEHQYPDQRASGLQYYYINSGVYYLAHSYSIPYVSATFVNVAVRAYKHSEIIGTTCNVRLWRHMDVPFYDGSGLGAITFNQIVKYPLIDNDPNRIQVSEVNNPFYYPAKNSYRVSKMSNNIVGIASQATPMSDGQFGYYPLLVFSTDGIFTLEQGVGEILYKSVQPLSLDVCNNTDSIIEVNSAVIFASNKGLMAVSGRQVVELSKLVEGEPKQNINTETHFDAALTALGLKVSEDDFIDFIETAHLAYDMHREELIVSGIEDPKVKKIKCSYIYNIPAKMWYKTTHYFDAFIRTHPVWQGIRDGKIYSIKDEVPSVEAWMLKSNPFKFATFDLKAITRLVTRAVITGGDSADKVYLYLYGSLDLDNWVLINGVEIPNDNQALDQIMIRNVRTTARYYLLVLMGKTGKNVFVGYESNLVPKDTQKVR